MARPLAVASFLSVRAAAHPEAGLSEGQPVGFAAVQAVGVSAEGRYVVSPQ